MSKASTIGASIWAVLLAVIVPAPAHAAARCAGELVTIAGTQGADEIVGTRGRDVIHAFGGNDLVRGRGGNDVICGGRGADRLRGGPHGDIIRGGRGRDHILGGRGKNYLAGNRGHDVLDGTGGLNHIKGGHGNDSLTGGYSSDTLEGGAGNDRLDGGGEFEDEGEVHLDTVDFTTAERGLVIDLDEGVATGQGTDRLIDVSIVIGSQFSDRIIGDSKPGRSYELHGMGGNDIITTERRTGQTVTGGDGDDILKGNGIFAPGRGNDFIEGGSNFALLDYRQADHPVTVDLSSGTATGEGTDTFTAIAHAYGSSFGDTMIGDDADNRLNGWGGDDSISGHGGDDTLTGGTGNDEISGGPGNDRLWATSHLGQEKNRVTGGPGDDLIFASSDHDDIDGGSDTDEVVYTHFSVEVDLAAGTARERPWRDLFAGTEDSLSSIENVTVGVNSVSGSVVLGDDGPNILTGGLGDDRLDGRGGIDTIDGGEGRDECLNGETVTNCESDGHQVELTASV